MNLKTERQYSVWDKVLENQKKPYVFNILLLEITAGLELVPIVLHLWVLEL